MTRVAKQVVENIQYGGGRVSKVYELEVYPGELRHSCVTVGVQCLVEVKNVVGVSVWYCPQCGSVYIYECGGVYV